MSDQSTTVLSEPLQRGLGYFVDQSHSPLFFAALLGVGDVLDHCLSRLDQHGRDVSPIVLESRSRTVVMTVYEPEPVSVQIVQEDGPLERRTEILGLGIGLGVLSEVRRAALILDLQLRPLTDHFYKRLSNDDKSLRIRYWDCGENQNNTVTKTDTGSSDFTDFNFTKKGDK